MSDDDDGILVSPEILARMSPERRAEVMAAMVAAVQNGWDPDPDWVEYMVDLSDELDSVERESHDLATRLGRSLTMQERGVLASEHVAQFDKYGQVDPREAWHEVVDRGEATDYDLNDPTDRLDYSAELMKAYLPSDDDEPDDDPDAPADDPVLENFDLDDDQHRVALTQKIIEDAHREAEAA